MSSRNSRSSRPPARSSRAPQSSRATRSAKAAQSGRIASRREAEQYSRSGMDQQASPSAYRSSYTPGTQGRGANAAYSRQTAAGQYSRNSPQYSRNAPKRMSTGKKVALGILCAFVVVAVGCGTAFALYVNSINQELSGGKTQEEMQALQDVLTPAKSFNEPFYMMLIGSDRREDDDSMGARSDTNIVARVDPVQNQVTLISIPRDTKINIDGYGDNKFNAAYNYGGASATIREASQLLDVEISHYAEVNFEELVQVVDAVGGVDVEVSERIDDPDAGDIVIEAGPQHLNGEASLVFARSRAYLDGDFTRAANQRELISALVDKVLSLPVTELPGVVQAASKSVVTDLSVTDIIALAQQFKDEGELVVYSAMVPSTTGYVGDVSYVFADQVGLAEMMKVVEAGGDPTTAVITSGAAIQSSVAPTAGENNAASSGASGTGTGTSTGTGTTGTQGNSSL